MLLLRLKQRMKTAFFVTVLWKVSFNISWFMLLNLSSASILMKLFFFFGKITVSSSLKNTNILEDSIQVDHRHNIDVSFIQIMIFNRQVALIFNSTFRCIPLNFHSFWGIFRLRQTQHFVIILNIIITQLQYNKLINGNNYLLLSNVGANE